MARADLEELRDEIATLAEELGAPLSPDEFQALQYWGEDHLRDGVQLWQSMSEAQAEFEAEELEELDEERDAEEREVRETIADEEYEEEFYADDYGYWDIEAYGDYGND